MAMIPVLLLTAVAQSDPAVTLNVRARPLSEVLSSLSEQSGIKLSCAPEHANEILVLRFKNKPLSTVRKKLAFAIDAEWKQNQSEFVLQRPEARAKEIAAQAGEIKAKSINGFLDKVREKLKATPTSYERIQAFLKHPASGNLDAPWQASPAGHYLLQIWLDLGPVAIGTATGDVTLTYSDTPNSAQKQLPEAAMKHLAQMQEELSQLADEAKDDPKAAAYMKNFGYRIARPMKTIIKLAAFGSSHRIWLVAYGASGEQLYTAFQSSTSFGTDAYAAPDELGKRAPAENLNLTGLQKEFERVREPRAEYSAFGEKQARVQATPELIEALLNPEKVDPLDYWSTEAVLAWAKDKDICVCLPDRFDFATRSCLLPGKFQLGKLKAIAEPVGGLKVVPEPDWFLGRSTNAPATEKARFNRPALGRFLRANYENKAETIVPTANYMFEAGKTAVYFGFWSTYRKTLWRLGVEQMPDGESHPYETWALMGSLKLSIPEMERGASITYGGATPKQKQLMTTLARSGYLESEPDANLRDIQTEPTEWMEKGLDPQTTFVVLGVQQYAVQRVKKEIFPGVIDRVRTAEEFGRASASWPTFDLSQYGEVNLGIRSRLLTRFKPTVGLFFEDPFDTKFEPVGKPMKASELPPDFLQAAERAYREAKKKNG